ncbi:exopolyphosphatase [Bordetella sp. 02P26C-1]|uniref:exopolyphosphatase n=1 Tax=Bordetella sp. 02P26C-1 TaxID=2683195 RepID=UPI001352C004|nr:exopolyphosphatase [Bordetella sp. 02P26C-1]MVW79681.1 exopolyphosphatase [Bordetella sp. 02P26C-1]
MDHLLAAVDIGSNSFRLSVARVVQHEGEPQLYPVDRLKETVRLAAGLDENNVLSQDAIDRAIAVLGRFGERLHSFIPSRVRAVATNTFRVARNTPEFLPRAEAALGFPIEVIAGREEARLIYLGVVHSLPASDNKRLVIDIGGGSTEVVIGKGLEPGLMTSLHMGCLTYSRQFFADGVITAERMRQAEMMARREAEVISKTYRRTGWKEAFGSSGTAKALYAILTECGFSDRGITRAGMNKLKERIIRSGRVIPSELPGIKLERAAVLPGGLAIMGALFDELGIEQMDTGDGALRVGVLHDLLGRDVAKDTRDQSVRQFMKRYHVDMNQAQRVRQAALKFFDTIYEPGDKHAELRNALAWTADLHEVGLSIAHGAYHKHTAYVLANADMPGFSQADQELLALLALGHQGKLTKLESMVRHRSQWVAILCLRLSVLLMRRRADIAQLPLSVTVDGKRFVVHVNQMWLAKHPLSEYTLRSEEAEWRKVGFTFEVREL